MAASPAAAAATSADDRLARGAERLLRIIGDGRTGLVLLIATGLANAVAAFLPDGPRLLDSAPYTVLLGALALSGVATVAVRAPAAWREWVHPGPIRPGAGALEAVLEDAPPEAILATLRSAGYRARLEQSRRGWAIHAVRRGWSRFAGVGSHLALVVIVLGAAIGAAFGSETLFSLLRGDQALLDTPLAGFSAAVRLEDFEAEFGADGRPRRLDTIVTFLRDGVPVRDATLRVNQPGDFEGYLVHPWTYGPAVRLRVTNLGGDVLLDAPVPLDGVRDGTPVGSADLPSSGVTLGLAITDADANELGVSVVGAEGLIDSARLRPGDQARIGDLNLELGGFDAWVTFLSRRDPGLLVLFSGAAMLSTSLAVAFWVPRRRVTVRPTPDGLRLVLRGERFDHPADELARLRRRLSSPA